MRGIWNIIIGLVFIVGGLTGKLVLIGTDSGVALAGVGVLMMILGIWRLTRQGGASPSNAPGAGTGSRKL